RQTSGDAGKLHEGAVGAELVGRGVQTDVRGVDTDRDVTTRRTVSRLLTSVGGDVTASAHDQVVGAPVVHVAVERTPGQAAVIAVANFSTRPAADLQAEIGTGHIIEARPIEAANLNVFDWLGLHGKISRVRSCDRQNTCGGTEKQVSSSHF